ncbi:MAG: hypothetical protein LBR53_10050 [Deltaproteobacteria bacterium]|jgi:hypothetical protein|nr:hypothetical protein [Deltaproteobacteria bacterium]
MNYGELMVERNALRWIRQLKSFCIIANVGMVNHMIYRKKRVTAVQAEVVPSE